jgi:hypothetical protein
MRRGILQVRQLTSDALDLILESIRSVSKGARWCACLLELIFNRGPAGLDPNESVLLNICY